MVVNWRKDRRTTDLKNEEDDEVDIDDEFGEIEEEDFEEINEPDSRAK